VHHHKQSASHYHLLCPFITTNSTINQIIQLVLVSLHQWCAAAANCYTCPNITQNLNLTLSPPVSQKACLTVEENTRLRSRLQAVEAGTEQRQASSAQQDYEEVIQLLEAEIRDLKNQLANKRPPPRGLEATKVRQQCIVQGFPFSDTHTI